MNEITHIDFDCQELTDEDVDLVSGGNPYVWAARAAWWTARAGWSFGKWLAAD